MSDAVGREDDGREELAEQQVPDEADREKAEGPRRPWVVRRARKFVGRYWWRGKIVLARRRLGGADPQGAPAPFVCGATRSGTTLLRLMLDAHPQLAIPSETHFVPDLIARLVRGPASGNELADLVVNHSRWGDFHLDSDGLRERFRALDPVTAADAIRAFYGLYCEREGKPRWGDKTPGYVRQMPFIARVLPEARFVHIVRDGRDVALSLLPLSFGPSTVEEAARHWSRRIALARRQAPKVDHYVEIRYEDLVLDTETTLRRVCEFVELEFDPEMLSYHERAEERLREKARDLPRGERPPQPAEARLASHALAMEPPRSDRVERWRTEMGEADRAAYEAVAGELLAELGYEVGARGAR